jgi:hypothetical protein
MKRLDEFIGFVAHEYICGKNICYLKEVKSDEGGIYEIFKLVNSDKTTLKILYKYLTCEGWVRKYLELKLSDGELKIQFLGGPNSSPITYQYQFNEGEILTYIDYKGNWYDSNLMGSFMYEKPWNAFTRQHLELLSKKFHSKPRGGIISDEKILDKIFGNAPYSKYYFELLGCLSKKKNPIKIKYT